MLSKSPSRPKSETVIGGGLCPDTWATAFNDSYVGTCRSCAFGQKRSARMALVGGAKNLGSNQFELDLADLAGDGVLGTGWYR